MSNENEVQNINGMSKEQENMVDRAKRIRAILDEEPQMVLYPFIRIQENGAMTPDVRLAVVKNTKDEPDTESADEVANGESDSGSEEQSTGEQPFEA